MSIRDDFPIFKNNPELIYFDSTATTQKPKQVIDAMKNYIETSNSSVHRWSYDISIKSEEIYLESKKIVAKHIGWVDRKEIIYTYNSTYAINLIVSSMKKSNFFKAWDKVLLSIAEHHANILPWLILKEEIWIEIDYIELGDDYDLDLDDFNKKYDEKVKVISFSQVSNVLGKRFNLEEIGRLKREDTIFIVDWSQSVPHFEVNVKDLNCDFLFFTGHKIFADTWIGVFWGKSGILNKMTPAFSWGGAIWEVTCQSYTNAPIPNKFEPGTPHMIWAVSLLNAFLYIENIWWYKKMEEIEKELVEYFLENFKEQKNLKMIWSTNPSNRMSVFTFVIDGHHSMDVSEILADNWIAVRVGKHCAHPLLAKFWETSTIRVSLSIYNTKEEIKKLFMILSSFK